MVRITQTFFVKVHKISRKYLREGFRDNLRIFVQGGPGGNGLPKFGGVGGKGGDVIAVAKENIFLDNVYQRNKRPPGEDLRVEVPVGVSLVTDLGKNLGELNDEGEELVVAKGGTGGHPKNGFLGTRGQAYHMRLDLKLIADIGLVGFPNAGKSTLLKAISAAKPKIASYPFTTVKPNVGILTYKDYRQISMADLPGLIEGAHANKGMGHKFLKHVERTKLLLMVVDINGFQLSPQHSYRNCLETVMLLTKELEMYNEDLLTKPSMLLINKMDSEGALGKFQEIKDHLKDPTEFFNGYPDELRPTRHLKFCDIIPISAKEHPEDVEHVKQRLRNLLDVLAQLQEKNETDESENVYNRAKNVLLERGPALI
ncbi:hypothetical protein JTB14_005709 [Gonioctena quinquepunctata]|nr:hypothetical protein JTB14_005709 [Gonioctena quinquepunctata]